MTSLAAKPTMTDGKQRIGYIFEREKARFLAFVRRRLFDLSGMDAEDILSDVAYSLLRRADVVGEIEDLSAYVFRSLTNRITDHQRASVSVVEAIEQTSPDNPSHPVLPPDSRPGPERALQQAELKRRLFYAIDSLSPPERAVWIATEIEGRSFRELSEDWEEPMGTLLSRKSRATEKLRQMLSEYKDYR